MNAPVKAKKVITPQLIASLPLSPEAANAQPMSTEKGCEHKIHVKGYYRQAP
jgi:hypothetical protein